MARPKAFDRDEALRKATMAFAERGYEGTSTDTLLGAMGIRRQSLYDTFGDKHALYIEALGRYNRESIAATVHTLNAPDSPLAGIEAALLAFAKTPPSEAALGCLGVSSICEFGRSDAEVVAANEQGTKTLVAALVRRITEAKTRGEIGDVSPTHAAQFLLMTLTGLKVSARAGAPSRTLQIMVDLALRSLR